MLTHFVFRVLQIEHEGPVFVFVFAVGAKTEVKHLLFNSKCQSPHLALCHFQIITVAHPGGNEQKNVCLNLQTSGNVFGTKRRKNLEKKKIKLGLAGHSPFIKDVCQRPPDVLSHLVVRWKRHRGNRWC